MQTDSRSFQHKSPLLYWVTLAFVVGVPNFVHFDATGRTPDPFNATAILVLTETVLTGYLLVVLLLLDKRPILRRRINVVPWLWIALALQFTLATFLQPSSRVVPLQSIDLFYSFYALGQWVIAFLLIIVLYSREAPGLAKELVVSLIGRACWVWITIVWIALPIMPTQVFGGSDENSGTSTARQLGGELLHPGKLAALSSIAFFYAVIFFPRGPKKWVACFIALVTLALTSARTGELGFIITLLLYTLLLSGNKALRWGIILLVPLMALTGLAMGDTLIKYVSRGQSLQSLESLDDRTRIWLASWEAIKLHPIFGYGYIIGAKKALRDHWSFAHWIPPHPHNELLGAFLDGGIIALILILAIYCLVFWRALRDVRRGHRNSFFMIVFLNIVITCISGPMLTYKFNMLGGIFLLCCIGILMRDSPPQEV